MIRIFVILFSISVLISFSSCTSSSNVDDKCDEKYSELNHQVDSLFNLYVATNEPGASVLITYDGDMIVNKHFGLANLESDERISSKTNFRIASCSKQFTALCILALVDQNKLGLKDEVFKYFPYPIFEGITVEQLINHTSGLPDYTEYFDSDNWDNTKIVNNNSILEWLKTNPQRDFNPGEKYEYSNTAYTMLPLLVEAVSGQKFNEFAKQNVFNKAGMQHTNYYSINDPINIENRALCYELDSSIGFLAQEGYFMNGVVGDGAIYTSIDDFFNYTNAIEANSLFDNKEVHELIFKPSSIIREGDKPKSYAMGWVIGNNYAMHTGGWNGARTFVFKYKDKPIYIALFMNRSDVIDNTMVINQLVEIVSNRFKEQN